jgi:hypothetical protein
MSSNSSLPVTKEGRSFPNQTYEYVSAKHGKIIIPSGYFRVPRKELVIRKDSIPEMRINICSLCNKLTRRGAIVYVKRSGMIPIWNALCRCEQNIQ